MKKKLIYLYRWFFWTLSRLFVWVYVRPKFNLKKDAQFDPIPKPPFIMISNHGTFFDPWMVGHYSRYPVSIMMNDNAYKGPWIVSTYLKLIGTFGKRKGVADFKATKTMFKQLSDGYPILVFPEGQTTWDGASQPIFPGIEKIVKKSGASLVMMKMRGNFLSKPWWAKSFRRGKVIVSCQVVPPEAIAQVSDDELKNLIVKHIRHNDIKDQLLTDIKFTGHDLAVGLEKMFWVCKACRHEETLQFFSNYIKCNHCNSIWHIDEHMNIKPMNGTMEKIGDLHDYSLFHKDFVQDRITHSTRQNVFCADENAILTEMSAKGEYIPHAEGSLYLCKESITFLARNNDALSFVFPLEEIETASFQRTNLFEIVRKDAALNFQFPGKSVYKWVYYMRNLQNYFEAERKGHF